MVLAKCKCKHAFQDEKYGLGMRVHTIADKQSTSGQKKGRCTVCGEERFVGGNQPVAEESEKKENASKHDKHDKHGKHSGREGREKKGKTVAI